MTRRRKMLVALLTALLTAAAAWSYGYMAQARGAAAAARADLAECYRLAGQIERCAQQPLLADEREQQASETTAAVERAARAAGIDPRRLTHIVPESAQRLGDSAYKEKPTQVRAESVTLAQAVALLHGLAAGARPLHPKAVRVWSPREDAGSTWTAEFTVTYLIYDPARNER